MFKRVEKRRRKLEKEESLGLTEEMKEVLGMHDTDSDESESESDSDSEQGSSMEHIQGEADEDVGILEAEDDDADEEGEDEESNEGEDEDEQQDEDEDEDEADAPEPERPPLSVTEAITDPIYLISTKSTVKACAVCPTKRFKDDKFVEEHKNSKAHYRRFARFVEFAGTADPETNMNDFWRELDEENKSKAPKPRTADGPLSIRAQKRKAKQEVIKAKRKKSKEMKAKGMAWKAARKAQRAAQREADSDASDEDYQPTSGPPMAKAKAVKGTKQPPMKRRKVQASEHEATDAVAVPAKVSAVVTLPAPAKKESNFKVKAKPAQDVASPLKPLNATLQPKTVIPETAKASVAAKNLLKKKRPPTSSS